MKEPQRAIDNELTQYAMLMHLSQFAAFVIPFVGWAAPIVMWFIKRDSSYINEHGKLIFNWMISVTLYSFGILLLFWFMPLLSIPAMLLLALFSVVMIILSAIQAKQGELKPYPLAIPFFS